ncbi:putative transmembrane protein [Tieghemostelium lacteum]|uniref:Putative transmembrane protein n=1 Tax=Tieghemostelium lacteum TaxID=361077 RepID=A0A151ZDQ7_TIELA|nr:putative transmembrane protein [Tieghemostelium lacteum]|eukprot:KYQ92040.1 putative transmembrane protein [Tieghemostelium lacteum]
MNKKVAFLISIIGVLIFLHTVYSSLQHRKYLRLTDQHFEGIPNDIIFECIVSLFIFSFGVVNSQTLTPIRVSSHLSKKYKILFTHSPIITIEKKKGF